MAETSKFHGLADLKNPLPEPEPEPEHARPAAAGAGLVLPTKQKPSGKRSQADWKQFSILLKIDSRDEALERLRKKYKGSDFSELMQALLEQWLKTT